MNVPFAVKNDFDHSETLAAHIERRLGSALRRHALHVRRVDVRLSDANGPRHGANDKVTQIDISLHPSGQIVTSAGADDVYASVSKAAVRAREALARHVGQRQRNGRRRTKPTTLASGPP